MEKINTQLENFSKDFLIIEEEIGKVIIGQKETIRNVLSAMIAGGNVLLEGLPGLGKTKLIKTIGDIFDMEFSRIQFTPDLMPADITGTDIIIRDEKGEGHFEFRKGPVFSNIVLADEINRGTPKTQSALLEAMQEKTVTMGRNIYKLPEPFFVLATQNPIEMEGTYPLPEAQLDRFIIKLNVDYPSKDEMIDIVTLTTMEMKELEINKLYDSEKLLLMREAAKRVPISEPVMDYAMDLIMSTNPEYEYASETIKNYVQYGSSPRGGQGLINMARVYALMDNRFNIGYEDIKKVAYPVLRHRIYLNFDAISQNVTEDDIIREILSKEI